LLQSPKWRTRAEALFRHRAYQPLFLVLMLSYIVILVVTAIPFLVG
jgi:hypothetical protein